MLSQLCFIGGLGCMLMGFYNFLNPVSTNEIEHKTSATIFCILFGWYLLTVSAIVR